MTTLITGAAGFIGSHVAHRLVGQGQRVVMLDNLDPAYAPEVKRRNIRDLIDHPAVTFVEGDVRDKALLDDLLTSTGVTRVCHLAAMANVRASIEQASLFVDVNVSGTINLLEASRKVPLEQFVMASTSSVYGNDSPVPFQEHFSADRPLAPYPASKRSAELMAHAFHNLFGIPVTVLRFFNVYGPSGRPDMMPLRVIKALVEDGEINVYNDGQLKRDWTYIDDIVDGVIASLNCPLGYEIINLGFGAPATLNRFIETLETLTGRQARRRLIDAPLTEPLITFCDNSKARRLLGFAPHIPLEQGLAETWAWYQREHLSR